VINTTIHRINDSWSPGR